MHSLQNQITATMTVMPLILSLSINYCNAHPSQLPSERKGEGEYEHEGQYQDLFRKLGFGTHISRKSDSIMSMIEACGIEPYLSTYDGFMERIDGYWREADEELYKGEEDLMHVFQNLGMMDSINEHMKAKEDTEKRTPLLIYMGAHPELLCSTLSDLKNLAASFNFSKVLLVSSDQKYPSESYKDCLSTNNPKVEELEKSSNYAALSDIMKAYLIESGINQDIVIIPKSIMQRGYLNSSERLRIFLASNQCFLHQFNKIIIFTQQPLGSEAEQTVRHYMNKRNTNLYRMFQFNGDYFDVGEFFKALLSDIEADFFLNREQNLYLAWVENNNQTIQQALHLHLERKFKQPLEYGKCYDAIK